MKEFTFGLATGMVVSAAVAVMAVPKKSNTGKRIGKTIKTVVDFVDDLGDMIRG